MERLAGTASEVEFRIEAATQSDVYGVLGRTYRPWTHATLHLAVPNWSMIWRCLPTDSSVDKITRFLNLIAPTMSEWMTNQSAHTQMKVYAYLDDDVLPNIENDILMTLLQRALELWNNGAIRLWLQSHDILQLVRGPLTPLE